MLYAGAVAGASLALADAMRSGRARVGINWGGGRHHAKHCQAGGFCFVNDVVLAILRLQQPGGSGEVGEGRGGGRSFDRVLYVDLDVHHGDGVEEAFYLSNKVCVVGGVCVTTCVCVCVCVF